MQISMTLLHHCELSFDISNASTVEFQYHVLAEMPTYGGPPFCRLFTRGLGLVLLSPP